MQYDSLHFLLAFSLVKTVKGEGKKKLNLGSLSAFNLCSAAVALNAYRIEFRGQGLLVSKKHKLVCGENKIYQIHSIYIRTVSS